MAKIKYNLVKWDDLEELYINQRLSFNEISLIKNCSKYAVLINLKKKGIPSRHKKEIYTNSVRKKMSITKLGKNNPFYGKHHNLLSKLKMSSSRGGVNHHMYNKHHSDETKQRIRETIIKNESCKGQNNPMFGKTHSSVAKEKMRLKKLGKITHIQLPAELKKKSISLKKAYAEGRKVSMLKGKYCVPLDKRELYDLYITQKLSTIKIAKLKGCNGSTIYAALKYFGIPLRTRTEALLGNKNCLNYDLLNLPYEKRYGAERAELIKKKISSTERGIDLNEWDEFISYKPYTSDFNKRFKEAVRERDNQCCVKCNKPEEILGYNLHIHHIDYNKKNSLPQNCVSLCRPCHTETNFNRDAWNIFYQKILAERYNYQYTKEQKIILNFNTEG